MEKRNPSKLRGAKGTVWENGTRVPFFVRWPGRYKPGVVDKNAALIDMFPTFLDIAGIELPADNKPLDGVSLRSLFEGDLDSWEDRLIFTPKDEPYWPGREGRNSILYDKSLIAYENQILSVRNQEYKLIKHIDQYRLFNIPNDPREEHDVIEEHPEIAGRLKAELKNWYEEILSSTSSYTYPRFLIGEQGVEETFIHACATVGATGNVKGGTLWTTNWLEAGDAQTILVEVLSPGEYHLSLNAKAVNTDATVQVSIGDQSVEARVDETNFQDLGTMELSAGKYDLEIRIVEATLTEDPVFEIVKGIAIRKASMLQ